MDIYYKDGLFLLDVFILFEDNDSFETIKQRIIETLYKDKRYSKSLEKTNKEEIENQILTTERNSDDYYIFNINDKPYRVALKPHFTPKNQLTNL